MLLYLLLIFWFLSEPKPNHFHIFPFSLFLSPQALAHSLSYKMPLSLLLLEVKHAFYFYSTISHILLCGIYLVARCIADQCAGLWFATTKLLSIWGQSMCFCTFLCQYCFYKFLCLYPSTLLCIS